MKMTLIKVKASKIDSQKHENYTRESEGAQNNQFEKLTKIEVRMQPKMEDYQ